MKERIIRKPVRRNIVNRKGKPHKQSNTKEVHTITTRSWWQSLLQGIIPTLITVFGLGLITYYGIVRQIETDRKAQIEVGKRANDLTRMRLIFDILMEKDSSLYELLPPLLNDIVDDTLRWNLEWEVCDQPGLPIELKRNIVRASLVNEYPGIIICIPDSDNESAWELALDLKHYFSSEGNFNCEIREYMEGVYVHFEHTITIVSPESYEWNLFTTWIAYEMIEELNIPPLYLDIKREEDEFFWGKMGYEDCIILFIPRDV